MRGCVHNAPQTRPHVVMSDTRFGLHAHPLLGVEATHPDPAKPKPTGLVGSSQLALPEVSMKPSTGKHRGQRAGAASSPSYHLQIFVNGQSREAWATMVGEQGPSPSAHDSSGPLGSLPGKEHGPAVVKSLGIQPCALRKLDLRINEGQTEGGLLGPMTNAQV